MIIDFNTGNAAFYDGNVKDEIQRILEKIIYQMQEENKHSGNVFDINGNRIGKWSV